MASLSFLFWALVSFGAYILWIGLVLLTEGIFGSLFSFLPLFLMPLFVLIFSFFVTKHLKTKQLKTSFICLSQLSGLALAGLLHFLASLAVKVFRIDHLAMIFDLLLLLSLLLGVVFGIKVLKTDLKPFR